MNVTIRLYKRQDLDLMALYICKEFNLTKAIKNSLNFYVNKENKVIETPAINIPSHLPKTIQFHIVFSEKENKDVFNLLKNVQFGYRNNFLKNLVRFYLVGPKMDVYLNNLKMDYQIDSQKIEVKKADKNNLTDKQIAYIQEKTEMEKAADKDVDYFKEPKKEKKEKKTIPLVLEENKKEEVNKEETVKSDTELNSFDKEITDSDFDMFSSLEQMMDDI